MKTRNRILTIAAVVIFGLSAAFAHAQSSPQLAAGGSMPNDGYVVLGNLSGDGSYSTGDRLCPPGTALGFRDGRVHGCYGGEGDDVSPVTAQRVLDQKYGVGRTVIVGYAPSGNTYTAVFFRLLKP